MPTVTPANLILLPTEIPDTSLKEARYLVVSPTFDSFSDFEINVYDATGRLVENLYSGFKSPGNHKVVWDASGFATGIYIVNMVSGVSSESLIITLVK